MAASSLVTILFTDLVASTERAQEIGDAAADELRRAHFDSLRAAVSRTGGQEVKTIGDSLMVAYPSAADAIAGAVLMQQAVERSNRGSATSLQMRVGLSAGDASAEDGDWFGTPVVEAARLCAHADGGQILATDIVRVLGGSRIAAEMRAAGDLALKGISLPVRAVEVLWEPEVASADTKIAIGLPPQVEQPDVFTFVGRHDQLDALREAWKHAVSGEPRAVFLAGEPGIGKTRLVKELARHVSRDGGVVLWGACDEEIGVPYEPWVDALRRLVSDLPALDLRGVVGRDGGELVRLLPELTNLVPDLDPMVSADAETERRRLFEAVTGLLDRLAARVPVLMVLDDLHWSGKPTLLLLRHVLRNLSRAPVLFVGTYRDTDLDRTHALAEMLADLRRHGGTDRIALRGLDTTGVVAFLESTAGHELPPDGRELARLIHDETEGNPFFIGEVLLHLAESGALVYTEGRWRRGNVTDLGIPEGVREVIGRRLSRLPAAANEVLGAASVVGREFDLPTILAVHAGDPAEVLDALEAAERARVIEPLASAQSSYRFAHALVRSTLYDELPTSRRLRLHQRVGHALAARPGVRAAELARHFTEAAALGEVDRAVEYRLRAGDQARDDLAFEEAAAHYTSALGVLDLSTSETWRQRGELLIRLGNVQVAMADPRQRESYLAAVALGREHDDIELGADALAARFLARGLRNEPPDAEIVEAQREALDRLGDDNARRRAHVAGALLAESGFTVALDERVRLYEEGLATARDLRDQRLMVALLRVDILARDLRDPHQLDRSWSLVRERFRAADGIDDAVLCEALLDLVAIDTCEGRVESAAAAFDRAVELANRLQLAALQHRVLTLRAARALLSGSLDETEQLVATISRWGEIHGVNTVTTVGALNYRLYAERGRLAELEPFLADVVQAYPQVPAWRLALGATYLQMGRLDDAAEQVRVLGADHFAIAGPDPTYPLIMSSVTRLSAEAGELEIAAEAYEYSRRICGRFVWTGSSYEFPVDLNCAGACAAFGRYDDALAHVDTAEELCHRADARSYLVAVAVTRAEILDKRQAVGDRDRAGELATAALARADDLGLGFLATRCRRILNR